MAARGMCSLNQESQGAETEQSTSLSREEKSSTRHALLFLPANHLCMGEDLDHLTHHLQQMR